MTLKLKENGMYYTNNTTPKVVHVVRNDDSDTYKFRCNQTGETYSENGRIWESTENPSDLVKEVEPITLVVGETYQAFDGKSVTILKAHLPSTYPFTGDNGIIYTSDGYVDKSHDYDPRNLVRIISPVTTYLKVDDEVVIVKECAFAKVGYTGKISQVDTDDTSLSYKVTLNYPSEEPWGWLNADYIELINKEGTIYPITKVYQMLVAGIVLYTKAGSKLEYKNNTFMFNTSVLNGELLVNTPLFMFNPKAINFTIDPVKGTHCKVWDENKARGKWVVVVKYRQGDAYPYLTSENTTWKHAEPAV